MTARRPQGPVHLTARWVLGHRNGRHCLLPHGEVVFDEGVIRFVGYRYPGEVAERHDLGNAILTPGLIDLDALSDLDTTILAFDNQPSWRKGRVWPKSYMERGPYEMYDAEELAFQKAYAFQALLRNGITTALPIASLFYRAWAETWDEFAGAAQAAADLGLRIYLGPAYRTGNPYVLDSGSIELHFDEERGLAGLDEAIRFCRTFEGQAGGLVRTMLAPDRIETCTETLLRRTAAAGRELGVPVRLHCCQGAFEQETVRRLHGVTSMEWLQRLGFLTPSTLLPHGTYVRSSRCFPLDGDDLAIVRDHGAVIVHCPLVAGRFGNALESFARYRAQGVRMGLGTDTSPPDLIYGMQIGVIACRIADGSASACSAADYFDVATVGGAEALGRSDLGRIQIGAQADLVAFELGRPHQGQAIDPIQTLLLAGVGRDARTVVVAGAFAMEDRIIPDVDEGTWTVRAQRQFDGLVDRYPDRTWQHPPLTTIFPPSYPVIARDADESDTVAL